LLLEHEDLLDTRDFENVNIVVNTYAGHKRDIIDLLKEEIDAADYLEGIEEVDYDPKLLNNPSFPSFR
jgi:hypothetical protein